MIQLLKKYWYCFINLLTNDKLNNNIENININKTTNNLDKNELKIVSVKVRYVKEKTN